MKKQISIGSTGTVFANNINDNFTEIYNSKSNQYVLQTTDNLENISFWEVGKIYIIKDNFEINDIVIPDKCSLKFEGGSFTKLSTGLGRVTFTGNIFIQSSNPCLFNITLVTTNGVKEINADWFDLEKQTTTQYNAKATASTTKNNTFLSNHNNFTINWGNGIYVFSAESNNLAHNNIGKGPYKTCLHFPASKGIVFTSAKANLEVKNIFIHSSGASWSVECSLPQTVAECAFENVYCISETDHVIQRALTYSAAIYGCKWVNFQGTSNNPDKGIFYNFGTVSNIINNIKDQGFTFTKVHVGATPLKAVFYDTTVAIMKDSSFCYGHILENIVYRSGTINEQGIVIDLQNNHFESISRELINITCNENANGDIFLRGNRYITGFPTPGEVQLRIGRCRLRECDFPTFKEILFIEAFGLPSAASGNWHNYTNLNLLVVNNQIGSNYEAVYCRGSQAVSNKVVEIVSPLTFPDFTIPVRPDNSQPRTIKEVVYINAPSACTTANLPTLTSADRGFKLYDTTRNKEVLWNGTAWVNVDGTNL